MRPEGRGNRNRRGARRDVQGLMQTIIIPKGTVDPNEVTIIEVPKQFQKTAVVIAKRKGGQFTQAATSQNPYFIESGIPAIPQPQTQYPGQAMTVSPQGIPVMPQPQIQPQPQSQPQYPGQAMTAPPQQQAAPQSNLYPVYAIPNSQQQQQQQPMQNTGPYLYQPITPQQQQQQPFYSPYPVQNNQMRPDLNSREQMERFNVNKSLEEFHRARRSFLTKAEDVVGQGHVGIHTRTPYIDLDDDDSSDSSILDDSYPCRSCRRHRSK